MKNIKIAILKLVLVSAIVFSMVSTVFAEGFNVTLKDVDITDFIEQVGKITGKTFIVDKSVKGKKITIISSQSLPEDDVYDLFLAVLQVNNFEAVPLADENVIKIVVSNKAKQHGIPLGQEGEGGEKMVTRVIPINNTSASELVSVLRPMVPSHGHLAAANSANALIVIDHASNIQVLESIIQSLDQQKSQDVEVFSLSYAFATDVVDKINAFVPSFFNGGGGAVSSSKGRRKTTRTAKSSPINVIADERTNRIFVFGEAFARQKVREMIEKLDIPGEQIASVEVVKLRYAKAVEMAALLTKVMDTGKQKVKKGAAAQTPKLSIQGDETTNSLLIRADSRQMQEIKDIINKIDLRRAQILIEAAILEVNADDIRKLGSELALAKDGAGLLGLNFGVGGTSLTSMLNVFNLFSGGSSTSTTIPTFAEGATIGGGGLSRNSAGNINGLNLSAIVQAITTVTKANILSTPSILTLDNQEATITVGDNVPFVTRRQESTTSVNPFVNVERQDVGIKLTVKPTITDEHTVLLEVTQEASQVKDAAGAVDLITSKREIKTTILIDDNQTVMLGGLMNDVEREVVSKVPFLGDIPILGFFFRSKSKTRQKTNLLVFLKPSIIRDGETAGLLTRLRYQKLRALQLAVDANGNISKYSSSSLPANLNNIYDGFDSQLYKVQENASNAIVPSISVVPQERYTETMTQEPAITVYQEAVVIEPPVQYVPADTVYPAPTVDVTEDDGIELFIGGNEVKF